MKTINKYSGKSISLENKIRNGSMTLNESRMNRVISGQSTTVTKYVYSLIHYSVILCYGRITYQPIYEEHDLEERILFDLENIYSLAIRRPKHFIKEGGFIRIISSAVWTYPRMKEYIMDMLNMEGKSTEIDEASLKLSCWNLNQTKEKLKEAISGYLVMNKDAKPMEEYLDGLPYIRSESYYIIPYQAGIFIPDKTIKRETLYGDFLSERLDNIRARDEKSARELFDKYSDAYLRYKNNLM